MIDKEALSKLTQENLEYQIGALLAQSNQPVDLCTLLYRFVGKIFSMMPAELISWGFNILLPNDSFSFAGKEVMHILNLGDMFKGPCTIIVKSEETFCVDNFATDLESNIAIRYTYYGAKNEEIVVGQTRVSLPPYYDSAAYTIFSQPSYRELDEALNDYDKMIVRNCSCGFLSRIWADNSIRTELVSAPEHYMRDSLWQFLRTVFRGHTIKREQMMDVSHPTDIKVTWPIIRNVALIEVKWLGDSGSVHYRDARANEGAAQLTEYINWSREEEPDKHFVGYLAVFDARRSSTQKNAYENVEPRYDARHLDCPDLKLRRFFLAECG